MHKNKPRQRAHFAGVVVEVVEAADLLGMRRGHIHDPFGNRIELIAEG